MPDTNGIKFFALFCNWLPLCNSSWPAAHNSLASAPLSAKIINVHLYAHPCSKVKKYDNLPQGD